MVPAYPVLVDNVDNGCNLAGARALLHDGHAPDLDKLLERHFQNTNKIGKEVSAVLALGY